MGVLQVLDPTEISPHDHLKSYQETLVSHTEILFIEGEPLEALEQKLLYFISATATIMLITSIL